MDAFTETAIERTGPAEVAARRASFGVFEFWLLLLAESYHGPLTPSAKVHVKNCASRRDRVGERGERAKRTNSYHRKRSTWYSSS